MSKYNVSWNKDARTLILTNADADVSGDGTEQVSHIVYGAVGEVPDSASHPEPGQHLRNIARQMGVDNYDLVTVVNKTDNERLDRFAKEADAKTVERLEQAEAVKVLDKPTDKEEAEAIKNADKVGPVGDRHADETDTTAPKGRGRKAAEPKAEDTGKNAGGEEGSADANAENAAETQTK